MYWRRGFVTFNELGIEFAIKSKNQIYKGQLLHLLLTAWYMHFNKESGVAKVV
jgi:hypothetical protein